MCLMALAWRAHPRWTLVLISNRDELHARPSAPAARWADAPRIIGGRDLEHGGTWLGVSEDGRLAAVTNVRGPAAVRADLASRGLLASGFLIGERDIRALPALDADAYRPFNLIAVQGEEALFLSNRPPAQLVLAPGLRGLSNGPLDAPWPKVRRAVSALSAWLQAGDGDLEPLFQTLADQTPAPDDELPDTGVGIERERLLSPCFLKGPVYGTRCSTIVRVESGGRGELVERRFGPDGVPEGATRLRFDWPA